MVHRSRALSDKSNASDMNANSENYAMEYFWSVVLNGEKRSVSWVVTSVGVDEGEEEFEHTLLLKTAVLGGGALAGEQNIVVLQSPGEDGKVQKGEIANLTRGLNPMATLDVSVPGRIGGTLVLSEGSGPVTIAGNHMIEYREDGDVNDETQTDMDNTVDESGEDEEEEVYEGKDTKKKIDAKGKAVPSASKQKKPKMDVDEDDDDDDNDDDFAEIDEDEEDDDYEEVKTKQAKKAKVTDKKSKGKAKSVKDSGKKVKPAKK